MATDLQGLIDKLRRCQPSTRIELREPILAHGTPAIAALEACVAGKSDLAASVAAWLEVLANRDPATKPSVVAALRRLAVSVPESDAQYVGDVLERLGASLPSATRQAAGSTRVPRSAGTEWTGFQAHEFGRNEGTRWRSATGRASLAPIILRELQDLDPDFISFGVERSPELHFAVNRRYRGAPLAGITTSKLVVYAHGPTEESPDTPRQAAAGWYIERGDGAPPYGDPSSPVTWDWPLLLRALDRPAFHDGLSLVMERRGLRFGDYGAARYTTTLGWSASVEAGELIARNVDGGEAARGWPDVQALLLSAPPTEWVDLHLVKTWPADEAIAAGQAFADRALMPVLLDLAPLYLEMLDLSDGRDGA